jgi:hypothetical protein
MLAKHKVGSSTLLTRSSFKPLRNQGLFCLWWSRGAIQLRCRFYLGCTLPGAKILLLVSRLALKRLIVAQVLLSIRIASTLAVQPGRVHLCSETSARVPWALLWFPTRRNRTV